MSRFRWPRLRRRPATGRHGHAGGGPAATPGPATSPGPATAADPVVEAAARARRGPHLWADEVGTTYLALDPRQGRPVAFLVEPHAHWRTTGRTDQALTDAVRAAAGSPGVEGTLRWLARIEDGRHAGRLVAEYREGRPLPGVLSGRSVPLPVALLTARRVASALSGLHQAGRHHGGFSTTSVLCTPDGPLITGHCLLPRIDPDRPRPGPADVHAFGLLLAVLLPPELPRREGRALRRLIRRCCRGPAVLRPSMARVSRRLSTLFYGLNLADGAVREEWAAFLASAPATVVVPPGPATPPAGPSTPPAGRRADDVAEGDPPQPAAAPEPVPPSAPDHAYDPGPAADHSPDHSLGPAVVPGAGPDGAPPGALPGRPGEHPADAATGPVRPVTPEPAAPCADHDDGSRTGPVREPARDVAHPARHDADAGDDSGAGEDPVRATVPLLTAPVVYTRSAREGDHDPRAGSGPPPDEGESPDGRGEGEGPAAHDPSPSPVPAPPWTRALGFLPEAACTTEGDLLFVAGTDGERGRVAAVGVRDGEVRWEHVTAAPCRTRPLPVAGQVCVADDSGAVRWLDAGTGRVTGTAAVADRPAGDPVSVASAVWLGGVSGRLHILWPGSGRPGRLRLPGTADSLAATPAVHPHGPVCLATYRGPVCLGPDGRVWWGRPDLGDTGGLDPVWCGDDVVGVTAAGLLFRLDRDGREVWRTELPALPATGPLLVAGTVVVVTADGAAAGVGAQSGEPRWHRHTGSPPAGRAATGDGTVLFAGRDRWLRCLDARTGEPRWTARTGGRACRGGPYPDGDRVYLGASDCHLYAIDARDGSTGGTGALHVHPLIDDKFAAALRTPC
ncbi:PQQ-binding-like beta-propeller repeat protein [Streptomyces ficellus]|uniref:Pyrrolo-quinoline quinone repeat domain-containing protein n=1 Tax=Streptomyces ficellus TaxID=1977088 RepID=A0A6I6FCZ9_9ACTN|nr:PQQ-binding-like beta-propeller repeat protein [Streptomyces ficellus]QGV81873.1 hypothetical protein EIZ62_29145 [Streptomyces ficellus]